MESVAEGVADKKETAARAAARVVAEEAARAVAERVARASVEKVVGTWAVEGRSAVVRATVCASVWQCARSSLWSQALRMLPTLRRAHI